MSFFTNTTNLLLIALASVSGALLVWQSFGKGAGGGRVSASQATQLINKQNAVIVDVRDATEFAQGHLPNAKNISLDQLSAQANTLAKNKDTPIIAVCQSGVRANRACAELKKAGYTQVLSLDGGLAAWQQAGMPVVGNKKG